MEVERVERNKVLPMAVENPRLVVLREEVNKRVLFCRVLVLMVDPDRVE